MKIDLTKFAGCYTISEARDIIKEIEKTLEVINTGQVCVRGVKIGDKFKQGKNIVCEVMDIQENRSLVSGDVVSHTCFAKAIEGSFSTNTFDVPFSTVLRNKIN